MKIYEIWEDGNGDFLVIEKIDDDSYHHAIKDLGPSRKLKKEIKAQTYEEAMQIYYDYRNFGKYKPL